jgi:hypothetical protein
MTKVGMNSRRARLRLTKPPNQVTRTLADPRIQWSVVLLLFAIMLATLPFWAQIKNLRTRRREPHKLVSSGRKDIILSDLKGYDEGLLEYVKI